MQTNEGHKGKVVTKNARETKKNKKDVDVKGSYFKWGVCFSVYFILFLFISISYLQQVIKFPGNTKRLDCVPI